MVFDLKIDSHFTRKAILVAGGHTNDPPLHIKYPSVVSQDSVIISFLLYALNDLEIISANICNTYLNAPFQDNIWTIAGSEFGSDKGWVVIFFRVLCVLNT